MRNVPKKIAKATVGKKQTVSCVVVQTQALSKGAFIKI